MWQENALRGNPFSFTTNKVTYPNFAYSLSAIISYVYGYTHLFAVCIPGLVQAGAQSHTAVLQEKRFVHSALWPTASNRRYTASTIILHQVKDIIIVWTWCIFSHQDVVLITLHNKFHHEWRIKKQQRKQENNNINCLSIQGHDKYVSGSASNAGT